MSVTDSVAALEKNIKVLTDALAAQKAESTNLRSQLQAAVLKPADSQLQLKRAEAAAELARREAEDAKEKLSQLTRELTGARQEINASAEDFRGLKAENYKLRKTVADTVLKPSDNQLHVKRLEAAAELAKREAADTVTKSAKLSKELADERNAREADRKRAAEDYQSLKATNGRLTSSEGVLRAELSDVRMQLTGLRRKITEHAPDTDEIKALRAQVESLNGKKAVAESRQEAADTRVRMAKDRVTAADQRVTELKESVRRLSAELSDVRTKNKSLGDSVAHSMGEIEAARRTLRQKDVELQGIRIQLEVAQKR